MARDRARRPLPCFSSWFRNIPPNRQWPPGCSTCWTRQRIRAMRGIRRRPGDQQPGFREDTTGASATFSCTPSQTPPKPTGSQGSRSSRKSSEWRARTLICCWRPACTTLDMGMTQQAKAVLDQAEKLEPGNAGLYHVYTQVVLASGRCRRLGRGGAGRADPGRSGRRRAIGPASRSGRAVLQSKKIPEARKAIERSSRGRTAVWLTSI